MFRGNNCDGTFEKGVANGAEWKGASGTYSDFAYQQSNAIDITLELSCCKHVPKGELRYGTTSQIEK